MLGESRRSRRCDRRGRLDRIHTGPTSRQVHADRAIERAAACGQHLGVHRRRLPVTFMLALVAIDRVRARSRRRPPRRCGSTWSSAREASLEPSLHNFPRLSTRRIGKRPACAALQLGEPCASGRQAREELLGKIETLVVGQRERILEHLVSPAGHRWEPTPRRRRVRAERVGGHHAASRSICDPGVDDPAGAVVLNICS